MKLKQGWLILVVSALAVIPTLSLWAHSQKSSQEKNPPEVRSTMMLKEYMAHFGSLVAGMEIMKLKEKNPDWDAIRITIQQMGQTLKQLQAADKEGNYKEFTDVLEKNLSEVKNYGDKKDKRVFDSFEKLTNTCFQCHAAHRPSDFLIPKPKEPRISEKGEVSN